MSNNVDPIDKKPIPAASPPLADGIRPMALAWLIYFNYQTTIQNNLQAQIDDLQAQIDAL